MNGQERLLRIFLRLQAGAHLSKCQLADEFEISEKMIQRDFALPCCKMKCNKKDMLV